MQKIDIRIDIRGANQDPADPAVCWEEQGPWRQPEDTSLVDPGQSLKSESFSSEPASGIILQCLSLMTSEIMSQIDISLH